jgi:hypothetical protein
MRDAAAFLERRLGRADVEPAEDLHGVAGNDFAIHAERQLDRQRALAGRGRAGDDDE